MIKWDLIHIALNELKKQWNAAENRDYFDILYNDTFFGGRTEVTIKWEPRVRTDSQGHLDIPRAMHIARKGGGSFTCSILDTNNVPAALKKDKHIFDSRTLWRWSKLNRDFEKLRRDIIEYKKNKENSVFLNDLIKVFPRTLDGALLGDDYDE